MKIIHKYVNWVSEYHDTPINILIKSATFYFKCERRNKNDYITKKEIKETLTNNFQLLFDTLPFMSALEGFCLEMELDIDDVITLLNEHKDDFLEELLEYVDGIAEQVNERSL